MNLNSIKKIQSETKDTLIEIKNINSRMDAAENQINDLEHKEGKNNQSEQEEKGIKKMRRVYPAHMEGAPQVPSLGDRGGCATGHYRTPTTLGHTTKTWSQSSST